MIVHALLSPQFDGKLGERMQFGELGSTAQEPEETVSCASAMLTIMTRKMIRASRGSRGTDPKRPPAEPRRAAGRHEREVTTQTRLGPGGGGEADVKDSGRPAPGRFVSSSDSGDMVGV